MLMFKSLNLHLILSNSINEYMFYFHHSGSLAFFHRHSYQLNDLSASLFYFMKLWNGLLNDQHHFTYLLTYLLTKKKKMKKKELVLNQWNSLKANPLLNIENDYMEGSGSATIK